MFDDPTLLIGTCVGGFVVLAALLFVVFRCLVGERSYENVAKQKQRKTENAPVVAAVAEQKTGKKKRRNAANQKPNDDRPKPDDEIEKPPPATTARSDSSATSTPTKKRVEIEPNPTILDPERTLLPERSISSSPSHSILVNKEEKALVDETLKNAPETFHLPSGPVDELDQRRRLESSGAGAGAAAPSVSAADTAEQVAADGRKSADSPCEKLISRKKKKGKGGETANGGEEGKAISFEATSSSSSKNNGTTQGRENSGDDRSDAFHVIMNMMQKLEEHKLSGEEFDLLRKRLEVEGKGHILASSSKKEKKDEEKNEVVLLKRNLQDTEAQVQKEKSLLTSSDALVKQLRQELASEKQKLGELEKSQIQNAKQSEDLKSRLQQLTRQKEDEMKKYSVKLDLQEKELKESSAKIKLLTEINIKTRDTAVAYKLESAAWPSLTPVEAVHQTTTTTTTSIPLSSANNVHDEKIALKKRSTDGEISRSSASSGDDLSFQTKKLEDLLNSQKEKNDQLRRRNWNLMETLKETEEKAFDSVELRAKLDRETAKTKQMLVQLNDFEKEKSDLERLKEDQNRIIHSLNSKIEESNGRDQRTEKDLVATSDDSSLVRSSEMLKMEESLNRQIMKNDDLRRRNWKTMEALSEMEKRWQDGALKRLGEKDGEIVEFANQLNAMEREKTEKLLREKDERIKEMEKRLAAAAARSQEPAGGGFVPDGLREPGKSVLADGTPLPSDVVVVVSASSPGGARSPGTDETNRKEVMFVTRIQETSKWDMTELVLELDTKTAEVEILQSLLEQNEKALREMEQEKSKMAELLNRTRETLREKETVVYKLQAQLKSSTQATTSDFSSSVEIVVLEKNQEIESLKAEIFRYQSQITVLKEIYEKAVSEISAVKLVRSHFKERKLRTRSDDFEKSRSPPQPRSLTPSSRTFDEADIAEEEVFDPTPTSTAAAVCGSEFGEDDQDKSIHNQKFLQEQVTHYQKVLSATELMLSQLQSSVEVEEQKWHQKVKEKEEKLLQAEDESKLLRDQLEDLRKTSS